MHQESEAGNAHELEERTTLKLPTLVQRKSTCDLPKDSSFGEDEKPNQFEITSKVESLPNISSLGKQKVKAVTFECNGPSDVENDKSVLRLPNIHKSYGFASLEEKLLGESYVKSNDNCFEYHKGSEGRDNNGVRQKNECCPLLMKNYEYQCEIRYTNCFQKLSRSKYSYFPRFPSPKPLSKKEKLKKEMEEKKAKKREDVIHPGSLKSKEEYSEIYLSIKKVEKQFVKKHKLSCRTSMDSPFFLD